MRKMVIFFVRKAFIMLLLILKQLVLMDMETFSLHELSHGESFLSLFLNRFWGKGLYILDEPEAALSPMRQMTLISRIQELVNDNSHNLLSQHIPYILLAYPEATFMSFLIRA